MADINLVYCGTHNCGIYRSAINFAAMARSLGHTIVIYPAEGLIKRPCSGMEKGDLTVLMLPPILMGDAYEYAGIIFNPDIKHAGYWYWETDCVPENWETCCKQFKINEVWAPNKFVQAACIKRKLSVPTEVVFPYVQPPKIIRDPNLRLAIDLYTFLFIFDFASCWERKNPFALLKAFGKAFKNHENVQLIVKSVRAFLVPGILDSLRREAEKTGLFITFVDGDMPFSEVHGLQRYADCYVSPHKGEGLGLTIIDAAYLGKPIIATGFGGNAALGLSESLNIKYKLVSIPDEVPAYGGEGRWAEPNVNHMAKLMRWCYEHQNEAREIGAESKEQAFKIFDEEKLKKELNINLKRILS